MGGNMITVAVMVGETETEMNRKKFYNQWNAESHLFCENENVTPKGKSF